MAELGGQREKMGLTTKIFLALLFGAAVGILLNLAVLPGVFRDEFLIDGVFYVIGQGFIRLMRMLVVPLVFSSLVCGSMSIGDTAELGAIGVKTLLFYLFTTVAAVVIALAVGWIFSPGNGLSMTALSGTAAEAAVEPIRAVDTLLDMIPVNIFASLAEAHMLQIIVAALLIGIVLAGMGERAEQIKTLFLQVNDLMMELTMFIMRFAPIGVFCLIAKTFAETGFEAFFPLLKYIFCVFLALAVQFFVVYMGMLRAFSDIRPRYFLKQFFPVIAFAFSTSASNATIPLSIETLSEKLKISPKISSFTIPLGATVNMDGTSIMQGIAVMFTAQAFGVTLNAKDFLTVIGTAVLASIGTAGIPGVGLVTLTLVFESIGLPVEGIGLLMGIDRILDMARTAVNVTGDAVCTVLVAGMDEKKQRDGSFIK